MKKISQSTFDEVVQENMDDFDMSKEDALLDAVKQFRIQGVDLSDIDVTGGIGLDEFLGHIKVLEEYLKDDNFNKQPSSLIIESIKSISKLCSKTEDKEHNKYIIRNQNLMNSKGGLNALQNLIKMNNQSHTFYSNSNSNSNTIDIPYPLSIDIQLEAINCLYITSKTNVSNRDFFEPGGSLLLIELIRYYLSFVIDYYTNIKNHENNNINKTDTDISQYITILISSFKLCRLVSKTEYNKGISIYLLDFIIFDKCNNYNHINIYK